MIFTHTLKKRIFDIIFSFIGLILVVPLIIPFIFLIWLQDFENPFYIADRIGLNSKKFKIISKFSFPESNYSLSDLKVILEANLRESLSDLKVESLDGFLFHNPNDLRSAFAIDILNWLQDLKSIGIIKRIGVSKATKFIEISYLTLTDSQSPII